MAIDIEKYKEIKNELGPEICLVAVSKTKSREDILSMHSLGQLDFGENYVQELMGKQASLPQDIRWHFIGHLQTNKVKQLVPFIHMIQGVDSLKLALEIDRQAKRSDRKPEILFQVHIAREETKFGFEADELLAGIGELVLQRNSGIQSNLRIRGLMGMASLTARPDQLHEEFSGLRILFEKVKAMLGDADFSVLSMGMSSDYRIAMEEGSNMIRIGSLIFGERQAAR
jgi:pyridoxal phosphate enzyme (YggS family)